MPNPSPRRAYLKAKSDLGVACMPSRAKRDPEEVVRARRAFGEAKVHYDLWEAINTANASEYHLPAHVRSELARLLLAGGDVL